jgi:HEAT repeat protein
MKRMESNNDHHHSALLAHVAEAASFGFVSIVPEAGSFCYVLVVVAAAFAQEPPSTTPAVATKPAESAALPSAATPSGPDELLLKKYDIEPTIASMRTGLRAMLPGSESERRQQKLIRQLGDDNYYVREAATKTLQRLPVVSSGLLNKAMQGGDPEVRWRAQIVLKSAGRRTSDLLQAALRVIVQRNLTGLAPEVLGTMYLCTTQMLRETASRALSITAGRDDAERLRKHLDDPSRPVRVAALRALVRVEGTAAQPDLRRLAADRDDVIKFEATLALLAQGRRDALPALGGLLESGELTVRVRAVQVLRSVSGKRFLFVAYEEPDKRREAVASWRKWIADNAQTVAIKFPLRVSKVEIGRTLICDYQRNRLVELDSNGKQVWEHPVGTHPWACQGLPNGHRLVASYSARSVTEYDAKGAIVWAKMNLPGGPTGVERLDNGNTLVACSDSNQVLELNRSGEAIWTLTIHSRPTDARRLPNGNTLICLQNSSRVVEVDRGGKTVWEVTAVSSPFSADRLENGNTLVCCVGNGQVLEYDRAGRTVWKKEGLSSPYCAQRLANGNTLIGISTALIEVDRGGKEVWRFAMRGISKFHRF